MLIKIDDAQMIKRAARRAGVSVLVAELVIHAYAEEYLLMVQEAKAEQKRLAEKALAEAEAAARAEAEAGETEAVTPVTVPKTPRKRAAKVKEESPSSPDEGATPQE